MDNDVRFRVERMAAPLRHSVLESLRDAIAVGRFKGGDRLIERELCELLGVSRTLVREALRQLESEGLVVTQANRGPLVVDLTREQAKGIYQVRRELEALASELFIRHASDEQRAALSRTFQTLKEVILGDDRAAAISAKNALYDCLMAGTGNAALGDCLKMLNSRVTLLRGKSMQAKGRAEHSIRELDTLIEAILAGNIAAARRAAQKHIENAAVAALAQLSEQKLAASDVRSG